MQARARNHGVWHKAAAAAALAATLTLGTQVAAAGAPLASYWSSSWTASPQPLWGGEFVLPTNVPFQFNRQTVRQVARLSVGGSRLRVEVSNEFGTQPLHIDALRIARHQEGSAVVSGTERVLYFGGRSQLVLAPGARAVSDPVDLAVPALSRVAVSMYLPRPTAPSTFHWNANQTAYLADGDLTAAPAMPATAAKLGTRVFLSALLVDRPEPPVAVVTLGDSLTDGNGTTPDTDHRWPDFLAERLSGRGVAVLNAGIAGGRLLRDGMGPSGLARVQRDVLAQPGVRAVIVKLGTNDIGYPGGPFAPHEAQVTAQEMIDGLRQLIALAHAHNVRIIGGTIAPNEGVAAGTPIEAHHSVAKNKVREAVNQWIRKSGEFDGVADFDAVLRDPARPTRMLPAYDAGDHLHPGDVGARAMAQSIDLDALLSEQ
ncbi:SGNH/GDSL hydrolase family protein [Variovorax sp. J2P1-59]|uniref:SGNH/GDSL hydrolase family protein n=1 Tax=Variovorax flavidus TaxID=3053501 RepID=UPI002578E20B|nr:SGNH/GDSL hydrolase family protein [Variovorax sp. J2P1-59]MDM0075525.1 SGNH/GDSL hydrolase family protein [Variovorax sp. J2P1-59]